MFAFTFNYLVKCHPMSQWSYWSSLARMPRMTSLFFLGGGLIGLAGTFSSFTPTFSTLTSINFLKNKKFVIHKARKCFFLPMKSQDSKKSNLAKTFSLSFCPPLQGVNVVHYNSVFGHRDVCKLT